jgi:RsiW-degrading membrane proteinase PrsW (M82 family)
MRLRVLIHHPLHLARRRWFKVWSMMTLVGLGLILVVELTGNRALQPAGFFYGAAGGPIAVVVAVEDRTEVAGRSRVHAWMLLWVVLFGAGVALMVAGILDEALIPDKRSWHILQIGFLEEPAKLIAPFALAYQGRYLTKLGGLALGLATSTGFAILETMAYAFNGLGKHGKDIFQAEGIAILRGLTDPFGHQIWTCIACAVAFGVWEQAGRVVVTPTVVAGVLAAILLHSAADGLEIGTQYDPNLVLLVPVVFWASLHLFHRTTSDLTLIPSA